MNFLRPTLLTLACLLASPSFADDLPSLGDASSAIVSPQQEYQLGHAWLSMLRSQVSQLNDPQLKDYVETSVYKLVETSQVQDRPAGLSGSTAGCSSMPRLKANTPRYSPTNLLTCRNATLPAV
jgi:predicted Zn-dependent protease